MERCDATLVTGASTGIGKELATIAAERGHHLVLVARSAERLEELGASLSKNYGVRVECIPIDLGKPGAPQRVAEEIDKRGCYVDQLVNNAGYGSLGAFHASDADTELGMIRLNVSALTHLTHLFLPAMVARGRGRVLNIASTAAFQPGPLMAVYYATKAYVLSFSEALAEELRGTGVTVTAFCPGPVLTAFQTRAKMEESNLFRFGAAKPRPIAEAGWRAMERGRVVAVAGWLNRLGAFSVRFSPRVAVRRVVKRLNGSTE